MNEEMNKRGIPMKVMHLICRLGVAETALALGLVAPPVAVTGKLAPQ